MGFLGTIKNTLNRFLEPLNCRIQTLTAERTQEQRLKGLVRAGHFDRPVFPLPSSIEQSDPQPILDALGRYRDDLAKLGHDRGVDTFSFDNPYFGSPDADVLYVMVRLHAPKRIVEVGSGNSTLVMRRAIEDGKLTTRLTAIDPSPRRQVTRLADELVAARVEDVASLELFAQLEPGDFLFVDSSHEIRVANDVLFLFLNVLPTLPAGVILHVHDIFLPYEYPQSWVVDHGWGLTEQYLLQAILQWGKGFEVIWPGYYLQKTLASFPGFFPFRTGGNAQSMWFRRALS